MSNRRLEPSAQNIDGIHGWMNVARQDLDDPFLVFDNIDTSGQRVGVKIGETLYPAPHLMTPEQLLLWQHKVESVLENGLDSISLWSSVVMGAITGLMFGLVTLLVDIGNKGWVVATVAVLMIVITIGISGPGFRDVRRSRRERRQLRMVHAAYLVHANRQTRPGAPTSR